MISGEVDKFNKKVIKDFISNLAKNEFVLLELQQSNIYLNQIEQKMLEKINQPNTLFKRLITGENQIEKEMNSRFATMSSEPSYAPQHHHMMNQESVSLHQSVQIPLSFSNDLSIVSHSLQDRIPPKKEKRQQEQEKKEKFIESEHQKKRVASEFSAEDLSEIDEDHSQAPRKLRKDAKIHILGTYDAYRKKHSFKKDKTEVTLENVFVKVEGMPKQIFLKNLHCTTRKQYQE